MSIIQVLSVSLLRQSFVEFDIAINHDRDLFSSRLHY